MSNMKVNTNRCHQSAPMSLVRALPMHSDLCPVPDSSLWYTCEWTKEWSKSGVSPKARMDFLESGKDSACNACYSSIIICEHIKEASKTVSTCPHTGFAFA